MRTEQEQIAYQQGYEDYENGRKIQTWQNNG